MSGIPLEQIALVLTLGTISMKEIEASLLYYPHLEKEIEASLLYHPHLVAKCIPHMVLQDTIEKIQYIYCRFKNRKKIN